MTNHSLSIRFLLSKMVIMFSFMMISGCIAKNPYLPESTKTVLFTPSATTAPTKFISKSTLIPTPTLTKTKLPLPSISATPIFTQPSGCQKPEENYDLVDINGMVINQRTYEMLLHAQELYDGEIELTGYHLTQGSYNNTVSASFGTHDGGGAVDFSVFRFGTYQVLYDDIEPLILALRTAGFAAWLRDFDQLYPGSPIHIHAIAVGDRDLSSAAQAQLTSNYGYFNGYNGIPPENGAAPVPDEFGGPFICDWMIPYENQSIFDSQP